MGKAIGKGSKGKGKGKAETAGVSRAVFYRLRTGAWGVRVTGPAAAALAAGSVVPVGRKDGTVANVTVARLLASGVNEDGSAWSLASIVPTPRPVASEPAPVAEPPHVAKTLRSLIKAAGRDRKPRTARKPGSPRYVTGQ
jgi:hypothetical protein